MLQYTSGSTGTPKGVMLSHANLMHNVQIICYAFEPHRKSIGLSWLPTYHDMGLVGGVLMAMFYRPAERADVADGVSAEADPLARGITKYGVTISGGPNFAYDLCTRQDHRRPARRARPAAVGTGVQRRRAGAGRYARRASPSGSARTASGREAFYPCYGMAETTLIVTGGYKGRPPIVRSFDGRQLDAEAGRAGRRRAAGGPRARRLRPRAARRAGADRRSRHAAASCRPTRSARSGSTAPAWRRAIGTTPRRPSRRSRRASPATERRAVPAHRRPGLPARRRAVRHRAGSRT